MAAFDCYLKIIGPDIEGECKDADHEKWIELLSYKHGVSQPASGSRSSGGAITSGRVDCDDFTIVHTLDKASPKLALACCDGTHFDEIQVHLCRAVGKTKETYMEYNMKKAIVASVRPTGTSQGTENLPTEEVTFRFDRITLTYHELDHESGQPVGEVEAQWDFVKHA